MSLDSLELPDWAQALGFRLQQRSARLKGLPKRQRTRRREQAVQLESFLDVFVTSAEHPEDTVRLVEGVTDEMMRTVRIAAGIEPLPKAEK